MVTTFLSSASNTFSKKKLFVSGIGPSAANLSRPAAAGFESGSVRGRAEADGGFDAAISLPQSGPPRADSPSKHDVPQRSYLHLDDSGLKNKNFKLEMKKVTKNQTFT